MTNHTKAPRKRRRNTDRSNGTEDSQELSSKMENGVKEDVSAAGRLENGTNETSPPERKRYFPSVHFDRSEKPTTEPINNVQDMSEGDMGQTMPNMQDVSSLCMNPFYEADAGDEGFLNGVMMGRKQKQNLKGGEEFNIQMKDGKMAQLSTTPFTHGSLPNFFDQNEAERLVDLLRSGQIPFYEKSSDLFDFKQTDELSNHPNPLIQSLRKAIVESWAPTLSSLLDIKFSGKTSMFGSLYETRDHLLCHDDQLEDRKVAFIYYLVDPGWKCADDEDDGGTLDLFSVDKDGQPHKIVKRIVPEFNSMAFFEVGTTSFHQVGEVFSGDRRRWAISGWLHGVGEKIIRPPLSRQEDLPARPQLPTLDVQYSLEDFIRPEYLEHHNMRNLQQAFEETSIIKLDQFFRDDVYAEFERALDACPWEVMGPPHQRVLYAMDLSTTLPAPLGKALSFLESREFIYWLNNCSDLLLEATEESQVAKLTAGCYTALNDNAAAKENRLELIYFMERSQEDWVDEQGGYIAYTDRHEELERVQPARNRLALVYRDTETMRFIKYLNRYAEEDGYVIISISYREYNDDVVFGSKEESGSRHMRRGSQ
eukprot:Clim_evm139s147 gene=Clim_evmTU139s147